MMMRSSKMLIVIVLTVIMAASVLAKETRLSGRELRDPALGTGAKVKATATGIDVIRYKTEVLSAREVESGQSEGKRQIGPAKKSLPVKAKVIVKKSSIVSPKQGHRDRFALKPKPISTGKRGMASAN